MHNSNSQQDESAAAVNAAIQSWRQGDCVLGNSWFFQRQLADAEGFEVIKDATPGLVIITQTCDVVRDCISRPYVSVCPLVEISDKDMALVRSRRAPRFAVVAALGDKRLVADLDRTMTVEKPVLASWQRVLGWTTDEEIRGFADSLKRKLSRFAYPNDFVAFCDRLSKRIKGKHGKNSDEGRALDALREIRVSVSPNWDADKIDLMFWFIKGTEEPKFEKDQWPDHLENWLRLLPLSGRFNAEGQVATLADMTAEEYVQSDVLDLDHLSAPRAE